MKEWYLKQTPKDQRMLLILAGFIVLFLIYALAIAPLYNGLETQRNQHRTAQQNLTWMKKAEVELRQLRGQGAQTTSTDNRAPYIVLDEAIKRHQLGRPQRLEPAGNQAARLQFASVPYDKLMLMLSQVSASSNLSVNSLNITRKESGLVAARLTVERK